MRNLNCSLLLLLFLAGVSSPALAQQLKQSEAEQIGLTGPVKSISTIATPTGVHWQQPGGPTVVVPIWCWKCEFDRDGNKIKSGQIIDSGFHGEVIHIIRDANGHVTERVVEDPAIGTPFRHEIVGPFGKTQEFFYRDGDLQFVNTFRYDQSGHLVDWLSYDRVTANRQSVLCLALRDCGTLCPDSDSLRRAAGHVLRKFRPSSGNQRFWRSPAAWI